MTAENLIRAALLAASPLDAEIRIDPATIAVKRPPVVQIVAEVVADNPGAFNYAAFVQTIQGRPEDGAIVGSAGNHDFALWLTVTRRAAALQCAGSS
jgi:hypothetical protein